jgi:hypothetical protein
LGVLFAAAVEVAFALAEAVAADFVQEAECHCEAAALVVGACASRRELAAAFARLPELVAAFGHRLE